jgi:ribonuclease HI
MDVIYIFTDGNCKSNGKKGAKGGSGVYIPQLDTKLVEIIDKPTNQRAELNAILMCFRYILENSIKQNIIIVSDSLYTINCLTNWYINWENNGYIASNKKPVKNKEIIQEIIKLKNTILKTNLNQVSFKHVRSHQSPPIDTTSKEYMFWKGNDIVDKMINEHLS